MSLPLSALGGRVVKVAAQIEACQKQAELKAQRLEAQRQEAKRQAELDAQTCMEQS